jgi:hypothetical protein
MRRPLHSLGEKVPKVKKRAVVTGERNARAKVGTQGKKGSSGKTEKKAGKKVPSKKPTRVKGTSRVKATRKPVAKMAGPSARRGSKLALLRGRQIAAPVVRVAVKPLDPLRKCGPNTTVQLLFRVDESVDGRCTSHLVFFDRHGWYCEHGRTCPAVGHARKFNGQFARVS